MTRAPARMPRAVAGAVFVTGAAQAGQLPVTALPEIALAGRSNVGKSSLLNRLIGRRGLARVSKTPGRTQQINFFAVGARLMLVDLPGYGFARAPRAAKESWQRLVNHYLTSRTQLRGVVLIVDARRGLQEEDEMLLDFLGAHAIGTRTVVTKIDKVRRGQRDRQIAAAAADRPGPTPIPFSAATGEGIGEVWRALEELVERSPTAARAATSRTAPGRSCRKSSWET